MPEIPSQGLHQRRFVHSNSMGSIAWWFQDPHRSAPSLSCLVIQEAELMLRTLNSMAAITRGLPVSEQLAHHFGYEDAGKVYWRLSCTLS